MIGKGVYPSPLGYCGFPKSICTSVNNVGIVFLLDCLLRSFNLMLLHQVICHGIPDDRILLDGDVVKIDVSVYAPLHMALYNALDFDLALCSFVNGVHGDNCHTFYAGTPAPASRALVDCTHECMMQAIAGGIQ
jgi:methionyl aminopeptidase